VRASEAEALSRRYLLPDLGEEFVAKGTVVYATPVEWLLRGFTYESSGHSGRDFYLWAFVQPLYIPSDHIVLNYGDRLGGSSHYWTVEQLSQPDVLAKLREAIRGDGRPFVESIREPNDFARETERRLTQAPKNVRIVEDAAYAFVLAGDNDTGRRYLKRIHELGDGAARGWVLDVQKRADRILDLLQTGTDPVPELASWRQYTTSKLGLDVKARAN
jgi:hypothetical protein